MQRHDDHFHRVTFQRQRKNQRQRWNYWPAPKYALLMHLPGVDIRGGGANRPGNLAQELDLSRAAKKWGIQQGQNDITCRAIRRWKDRMTLARAWRGHGAGVAQACAVTPRRRNVHPTPSCCRPVPFGVSPSARATGGQPAAGLRRFPCMSRGRNVRDR
eukprot:gene3736-biopygen12822